MLSGGAFLFLALFATVAGTAQQLPTQSATPAQIVIDPNCRLVTPDLRNPAKPRNHYQRDITICRLESVHESSHWEKQFLNGRWKNVRVTIHEREFILQNPYPRPVPFLVEYPLGKNQSIDSDPQPTEIVNQVAIFHLVVNPRESARLHVGARN